MILSANHVAVMSVRDPLTRPLACLLRAGKGVADALKEASEVAIGVDTAMFEIQHKIDGLLQSSRKVSGTFDWSGVRASVRTQIPRSIKKFRPIDSHIGRTGEGNSSIH